MDLVTRYVANGYGIGLSIDAAAIVKHPQVRVLPLEGFEPVEVAVLWNGELTPLVRALVGEMQRFVRQTWPQWQCEEQLPE
jgi:hypothetical protein